MAYYTPPQAPRQGQMTVDSSRFQAPAAAPMIDPFQKAFDLKKQAMEMKGMERAEKEKISQEVANKMQGDIFAMGDASADFDPDAILEGGIFNNAELQKRKFNDKFKASAWKKYQSDAKKAGGLADRQTFETVWGQGKAREDAKILNEMWADVQTNRMSEKDFNLAVRDNGSAFRDMYKDMSTDQKQSFQQQYMEAQGWDRYTPGYETTFEKYTGTGPGDETSDMVKSPVGIGLGTAVLGSTIMGVPGVKEFVGGAVSKGYAAMGYGPNSQKAMTAEMTDLKQKAKDLRSKATKKYGATPESEYKDWQKGKNAEELKNLRDTKKSDPSKFVGQKRLDELKLEEKKFKDKVDQRALDRKENNKKIRELNKKMGGGVKGAPAGGAAPGGGRFSQPLKGKYFRGESVPWSKAGMRGMMGGQFAGYITGAGSRMLLGEDSKGARLTNEAMETIGTQAGMGSGQVAMMSKIKNVISKKGYKWVLKKIARDGGLKLAMGVGAKAILGTAGGVVSGGALTAVSAGLLAKDLYDIALILSE